MKIGLVIYGSLDTVSGGYKYDRKLVEHLTSQGDQIEIFSLPWRNFGRHLLDNVSGGFLEALSRAPLDVLIQDELNHPSLFVLNRRLRRRGRYPIVSVVHHLRCSELRPSWQNRLYGLVERWFLSTLDGFVCVSRTTRSTVEALVGSYKPCIVAYPGRDGEEPKTTEAQIRARAQEPSPLRILFVGNVIHRKNLHTLISALERLPRESWRLEVVGSLETDRHYVEWVRAEITRHNLDGLVELSGTVTGDQLAQRYAHNHLLAVPSSYEGFGMVYLEGMRFGLPALASTAGAAHEIVTHGKTGFLVNPSDPELIARTIHLLHQDRHKLIDMGLAALERHRSHPTWTESAAAIRNFLHSMVTGS